MYLYVISFVAGFGHGLRTAQQRRKVMVRLLAGMFLVLHGLVHLLYFGQSQRLLELQTGMVWPEGSWAFSQLLGGEATRLLAGASCVLAAIGFVAGGIGMLASQRWWRAVVVGAAILSAAVFVLCWDGAWQNLDGKGAFAILINAAIVAAVLILQSPGSEV